MLAEISPSTSGRRRIEVYCNERYSPISGWSNEVLLITDRGKYSTADGGVSFQNLEDADIAFVSTGWVWDGEWERDFSLQNVDENGFSYATDFIGFDDESSGVAQKSMIHFVRRKRLIRYQYLDVTKISNDPKYTCDNCDLEELDRVEIVLRDVVVESTLKRHPRYLSQPKINTIKDMLISLLKFNKEENIMNTPYSTEALQHSLEELTAGGASNWAMASAVLHVTGNNVEYQANRAMEVLKQFPSVERNEISKLIIRKYDKDYQYHCNVKGCGNNCIFRREVCPNANCGVIYSKKWDMKHDVICPEKLLDCDRLCGERVIRKNMAQHLLETCTLRPVTCPFNGLGCSAVCAYRSLDDHLDEYMQSHLMLSLHRIEEQQSVIISLNRRIQYVESHVDDFEKHYTATTTGLAASIAALEIAEKRGFKTAKEDLDKLDAKAQRITYDLGTELRAEIVKIKRQIKI